MRSSNRVGKFMYFSRSNQEEFLRAAAKSAPWLCRLFRWSIPAEQIDAQLPQFAEWLKLKSTLLPGDLIWPFEFNRNTLAYRNGYVVIRKGPVDCIVTILS